MKSSDPYAILDLVVNDAPEGVDIIRRHRRLYAMLLADAHLHDAFIAALELEELALSNREPPAAGASKASSTA